MQTPEFEDDVLGRLRRTRLVDGCRDEYKGAIATPSGLVELTLLSNDKRDYTPTVKWTRELLARLPAVLEAAGKYAAETHVTDYNERWRDEGAKPLSVQTFLEQIRLTDIMIDDTGDIGFWYDAGEPLGVTLLK